MSTASGYRIVAVIAVMALSACDISFDGDGSSTKVNGSVHILAGKTAEDARTVNGSIHVDDNAAVASASTVNGSVHLGAHATASSAKSVNGAIALGDGAHVSGGAGSVNGDLTLNDGAEVAGALTNVNGKIVLPRRTLAAASRPSAAASASWAPLMLRVEFWYKSPEASFSTAKIPSSSSARGRSCRAN